MASLERLLSVLDPANHIRGRQFERICKWYLQHAPEHRGELRHVWLWDEWPERWGADTGIDLVAQTTNGDLWAIQAKCFHREHRITKRDIDSFLSESARDQFSYRLLLSTAAEMGANARRTVEALGVGYQLRADLARAEIEWPESPDEPTAAPRPLKKPRPHQAEAIEAAFRGLEAGGRGQLIMACGTGKTLTALWIAERLAGRRVLVLLPSLSLLAQTLRVWAAEAAAPFRTLAVCSDESVTRGSDDIVSRTAELGFPVTTDAETIARFVNGAGTRIVFSTYQSSPKIADAFERGEGNPPPFDLVIADEAHRCAGRVTGAFATVLDAARLPSARRLFMTATPRTFTGHVRKVARESDWEIASMDDPQRFGPVLHRLSFGEAIQRDLLTDYQVLIVGVTDQTIGEFVQRGALVTRDGSTVEDARTLSSHVALAKAMKQYDLGRVVSFHNRVSRAKAFSETYPDVVAWMPQAERLASELWTRHVSGKMSSGKRDALLDEFRTLDTCARGLISNARCLSEGVDVPAIDGVAFVEPRSSQVDIVQAVGRAIRLAANKKVGTIVLSVFIDDAEAPEAAIDSSAFKHIWQVLRALRDHDDELAEELDNLRRQIGRKGGVSETLPDKIHLDIPVEVVGEGFVRAFETRLVEQTTASWEFWFGLLEAYADLHGTTLVSNGYVTKAGYRLWNWAQNQRAAHRRGQLSSEQFARLSSLTGWDWAPRESRWNRGYHALAEFTRLHGHARVPARYETSDGYPLGNWVSTQRIFQKKGKLAADRQSRLEALAGWIWDPWESNWDESMSALRCYVESHGHARVPSTYSTETGINLGAWVVKCREKIKRGELEDGRRGELENLPGWVLDTKTAAWEEGLERLRAYAGDRGTACVPSSHCSADGFALGAWVVNQRLRYSKGKLPSRQQSALEQLPGWVWNALEGRWQDGFDHLLDFVTEQGHSNVHGKHISDDGYKLGNWVKTQQSAYKSGTIRSERIRKLETVAGWQWNVQKSAWERGYQELLRYVDEEGHALVPTDHLSGDGYRLGAWVSQQRTKFAKGMLPGDRQKRLSEVPGWCWNKNDAIWSARFKDLLAFVVAEGHARVHKDYTTPGGAKLGSWVQNQRSFRRRGTLDDRRADALAALPGWVWDAREARWQSAFSQLEEFVVKHGHARPSLDATTDDGFKLGVWAGNQRIQYRKKRMVPTRVEAFEQLPGWEWDPGRKAR